jgi:hypothetical protein
MVRELSKLSLSVHRFNPEKWDTRPYVGIVILTAASDYNVDTSSIHNLATAVPRPNESAERSAAADEDTKLEV